MVDRFKKALLKKKSLENKVSKRNEENKVSKRNEVYKLLKKNFIPNLETFRDEIVE